MKKQIAEILLVVTILLILATGCGNSKNLFVGKWKIDQVTEYEFADNGKGALVLPDSRYDFSYSFDETTVKIDFIDEKATDGEYLYSFFDGGNKLELKGKEDTQLGVFRLFREN